MRSVRKPRLALSEAKLLQGRGQLGVAAPGHNGDGNLDPRAEDEAQVSRVKLDAFQNLAEQLSAPFLLRTQPTGEVGHT